MPTEPLHDEAARLAQDFTEETYGGYRYLARNIDFRAKLFLRTVTMDGGFGAAKRLLKGRDTPDGFARLWDENTLGQSVDVSVLRPKFGELFSDGDRVRFAGGSACQLN